MVAPIRDIRNKFSSTSAFNNFDSNIALGMDDVDINDKFVVNTIIHNNCDNYNEVRDCTLVSSANNSHYISYSFSNMSEEVYTG